MLNRALFSSILCGTLALSFSRADAAVIFADDFSEANGTVLKGKAPDTGGLPWEQTVGGDVAIQNGVIDTTGAARVIFGNFASTPSVAAPVFTMTVDVTLISHNGGFAGFSLYQGDTESIFFGDLSGDTTTWGLSASGVSSASSVGYSGPHVVTMSYDFNTGLTQLFDGAAATGTALVTQNVTPGLALNRFRIANNNGGDIALSSVTVQASPIPEPGAAVLLLTGLAGAGFMRRRK